MAKKKEITDISDNVIINVFKDPKFRTTLTKLVTLGGKELYSDREEINNFKTVARNNYKEFVIPDVVKNLIKCDIVKTTKILTESKQEQYELEMAEIIVAIYIEKTSTKLDKKLALIEIAFIEITQWFSIIDEDAEFLRSLKL